MATATTDRNERDSKLFTLTRTFRGVEYTIRELDVDEFEKINEDSTIKETIQIGGDDREIERIDGVLQMKLMMKRCVSPAPPRPCPLRIYNGLREAINEVNFGTEKDETPQKSVDDDEQQGEGDSKGNG